MRCIIHENHEDENDSSDNEDANCIGNYNEGGEGDDVIVSDTCISRCQTVRDE